MKQFFHFFILTLIFNCNSYGLKVEPQSNYLRLNLASKNKSDFTIKKHDHLLQILSSDESKLKQLFEDPYFQSLPNQYFEEVSFTAKDENDLAQLNLKLSSSSVELFSFYKQDLKHWIVDLWRINSDEDQQQKVSKKTAAIKKAPAVKVEKKEANFVIPKVKKTEVVKTKELTKRDFRYGVTFIWDADAALPKITQDISLKAKTPEFFYPIKDRELKGNNELEAHLQMIIQNYRQEKFGMMTKAIDLFREQYGDSTHAELIAYIAACALLKSHIRNNDRSIQLTAIKQLRKIAAKTSSRELKVSIARYDLQYNLDNKNYIESIKVAKGLLKEGEKEGSNEIIHRSIEAILFSLAKLNQVEALERFMDEDIVRSWTQNQQSISFKYYSYLKNSDEDKLLKHFQQNEKNMQKPIDSTILFNVAEAYFRKSEYRNALKYFDQYLKDYFHQGAASQARIRLALCYDLLDKNEDQVLALYRKAVDFASDPKVRAEAKLRYVGYSFNRLKSVKKDDLNQLAFLNLTPEEEKALDPNLRKALWQTRLRTYLQINDIEKAHTYFQSIPVGQINLTDREVFLKDYSEVIMGIIRNNFKDENYARVIKDWSIFSSKYSKYIGKNQELLYYVALSYLETGFVDEYKKLGNQIAGLGQTQDYYPRWLERRQLNLTPDYFNFIVLVHQKQWSDAVDKLQILMDEKSLSDSLSLFYQGHLHFQQDEFSKAVDSYEKLMISGLFKELPSQKWSRLLGEYLDGIRKVESDENFQKKSKAVILALDEGFPQYLDRYYYLLAESYAKNKIKNLQSIQSVFEIFNQRYTKSSYFSRVRYLYGSSLIANNDKEEGIRLFKELMQDADTPSHIKEMTKSELNSLDIASTL